jgi:vitamin B12 transporter
MDMKRRFLAAFASATCLSAAPTAAQDFFDLGTLVLTGGFTPIAAEEYGRSGTVVTREDIEARNITSVQDALRTIPGVNLSSAGNNVTQVRIRGGEASHTLILIDGVEAAGGDGEYVLSGLEVLNIERIEVLRGPQSVFYGSNASAGVINIITDKGAPGQRARARVQYGAGYAASLALSSRGERGGLSFSLSDSFDEGWDFSDDGGEKDSTKRQTLLFSGDIEAAEGLTLGFTFRRSKERFEFDSASGMATTPSGYIVDDPAPFSTRDETTASVFAEYQMSGGRLVHRLSWNLTDNDQAFFGGAPTATRAEALKYRLSYALDGQAVPVADQTLTFFAEHAQDASDSNPDFDREATSYAVEYRGSLAVGLDLQAGVRFDDNTVFDDATTWVLGVSYTLENGLRLHASAGTGIVNPSYFELYTDAFGFTGNPNLSPERNQSWDIGVEVPFADGRGLVDVTYFDERLQDEIVSTPTGPGTFSFVNEAGESTRRGVEVEGMWAATRALDLRFSYTWLEAENGDGTVEIRRPKHQLTLGATMATSDGRGLVSADIRHVAGNFDTQFFGAFETLELPVYTTVDVAARYAINDTLSLTGRVENLFDGDAVDVWGYAGRPRAIYVGLDATW